MKFLLFRFAQAFSSLVWKLLITSFVCRIMQFYCCATFTVLDVTRFVERTKLAGSSCRSSISLAILNKFVPTAIVATYVICSFPGPYGNAWSPALVIVCSHFKGKIINNFSTSQIIMVSIKGIRIHVAEANASNSDKGGCTWRSNEVYSLNSVHIFIHGNFSRGIENLNDTMQSAGLASAICLNKPINIKSKRRIEALKDQLKGKHSTIITTVYTAQGNPKAYAEHKKEIIFSWMG